MPGPLARSGDVVVPLRVPRAELAPVSRIRSTLLLSSTQSLKTHGHYERYVAALDPEASVTLAELVAGVWIPLRVAEAHYLACEALHLPYDEQAALGQDVNDRVQGSVLGVSARAARSVGATPWTVLTQTPRLWDRVFEGGGGVEVRQTGPKDAVVEMVGLALLDIPYFRHGFRGAFLSGLGLFCRRAYVTVVDEGRADMSASYDISWA
ncbi:MAG: hypothetical protein ACRELB_05355 [Polyangiaceae bacterium]